MNYPEPMVTISLKEYNDLKSKVEKQIIDVSIPINSKVVITDGNGVWQAGYIVSCKNLSDERGSVFDLSGKNGTSKLHIVFPE